ncbi:hypothetical protein JW960_03320 [candidate division KSB1 bacterium]|nr:hypothetical protein [candidate division KSB1 bacterium]
MAENTASVAENKVNKRTAMVYAGAAFLIVVVGVRTLAQTMDEGLNWIGYITIAALAVEFSLLLLYAYTIYQQPAETTGAPQTVTPVLDPRAVINDQTVTITKATQELSNKLIQQNMENIKAIQKMNQDYAVQLAAYLKQMKQMIAEMEQSVHQS